MPCLACAARGWYVAPRVGTGYHNQRPQAIAATGFSTTAVSGHCSHRSPHPCGRRLFPTQAFHAATCHVQWSDWGPAGETAVDRFLVTGAGLEASAQEDEVSLPYTGSLFSLA